LGNLHTSRPRPGVVLIEIDNPPSNALALAIRHKFEETLDNVQNDLSVRAVLVTGRGKGFCAGADLKDTAARESDRDTMSNAEQGFGFLNKIEHLRVPVIAAVNGYAVGGGFELALACDIRIAATNAFFVAAAVNIGLIASVYRLPRLIGIGPAKSVLLTGNRVTAETALTYGLVTEVHPPEDLMQAAILLAERVATRAPLSVEASKKMIAHVFDMDSASADKAIREEFFKLRATGDHKHAVECFRERAQPKFTRN
jgi:enoyl-CoA hydratase